MKQILLLFLLISLNNTQFGMESESVSTCQVPSLITLSAKNLSAYDARWLINNNIENIVSLPIEKVADGVRQQLIETPLFQDMCRERIEKKYYRGPYAHIGFNIPYTEIRAIKRRTRFLNVFDGTDPEYECSLCSYDLNMNFLDDTFPMVTRDNTLDDQHFNQLLNTCAVHARSSWSRIINLKDLKKFESLLSALILPNDIVTPHPDHDILLTHDQNEYPKYYINYAKARSFKELCEQRMPLMQALLLTTIDTIKKNNSFMGLTQKEYEIYSGLSQEIKDNVNPYLFYNDKFLSSFQYWQNFLK